MFQILTLLEMNSWQDSLCSLGSGDCFFHITGTFNFMVFGFGVCVRVCMWLARTYTTVWGVGFYLPLCWGGISFDSAISDILGASWLLRFQPIPSSPPPAQFPMEVLVLQMHTPALGFLGCFVLLFHFLIWVTGFKLRSSDLYSKHFYLLNHSPQSPPSPKCDL